MSDFCIWGRVEHIGPSEFFVVASAVSAVGDRANVVTRSAESLAQAEADKESLMIELGALVRARGDRVVDVE